MFTVDKVEIGHHIADLFESSRFKSARQFGKEYLRVRYGSVDEDAIPNIQNRISQIINGKKWIQMEDLPIFADLLGVSVEDIVSAGTDVKRRTFGYNDTWLKDKDDLRFKMMSLAIKNKDFEMLTRLHAREIPLLYTINHFLTFNPREDKLPESKNIEQFTQSLASCSNTTLAYFFDSFMSSQLLGMKVTLSYFLMPALF